MIYLNTLTEGTAGGDAPPLPVGDVGGGDVAPFWVEAFRFRLAGTAGVYEGVRASMKPVLSYTLTEIMKDFTISHDLNTGFLLKSLDSLISKYYGHIFCGTIMIIHLYNVI